MTGAPSQVHTYHLHILWVNVYWNPLLAFHWLICLFIEL